MNFFEFVYLASIIFFIDYVKLLISEDKPEILRLSHFLNVQNQTKKVRI